eukprot:gene15672-biopygen23212
MSVRAPERCVFLDQHPQNVPRGWADSLSLCSLATGAFEHPGLATGWAGLISGAHFWHFLKHFGVQTPPEVVWNTRRSDGYTRARSLHTGWPLAGPAWVAILCTFCSILGLKSRQKWLETRAAATGIPALARKGSHRWYTRVCYRANQKYRFLWAPCGPNQGRLLRRRALKAVSRGAQHGSCPPSWDPTNPTNARKVHPSRGYARFAQQCEEGHANRLTPLDPKTLVSSSLGLKGMLPSEQKKDCFVVGTVWTQPGMTSTPAGHQSCQPSFHRDPAHPWWRPWAGRQVAQPAGDSIWSLLSILESKYCWERLEERSPWIVRTPTADKGPHGWQQRLSGSKMPFRMRSARASVRAPVGRHVLMGATQKTQGVIKNAGSHAGYRPGIACRGCHFGSMLEDFTSILASKTSHKA